MAPLNSILITPFDVSLVAPSSCLSQSFYGNYGGQGIFISDMDCLQSSDHLLSSGHIVPATEDLQQLVWLEEKATEESVRSAAPPFTEELDDLLSRIWNLKSVRVEGSLLSEQETLEDEKNEFEVLFRSDSSALLSVSSETALVLDTTLPRFVRATPLPPQAVPFVPVPSSAISRVKDLLSSVKFDPVVASIVSNISIEQMTNDIRFLTGEDTKSGIVSRHSFSEGGRTAAAWLSDRFEETGATCEFRDFLVGFAPNVICRYPSTVDTTATVLLSAHYDSRGSFGSTRAPGGDDDGSGTTALLAIARTIKRKGLTFRSNVELAAFAGEEQGLLGSRAYAREMKEAKTNLTLMIQADMLAYHAPGEPAQLGLPQFIGTPEVALLVSNMSSIYSPELQVGYTAACCSDHQSFHEQGFPATQVFERAGPIADPMYHNSGDLSEREGYDLEQVKSIAKAEFAVLLHAAGYDLP
ncbi:hypothetical protein JAAARDRAFT_38214 [Jaapia argillacea MUCL 33604]|uniref:Peptide hydrolase n=1 Tax=Jaapia argillacea MUCL 33604 TaxID=933084 RepID=A0A067PL31_9AGAM|nr:hypothetical protein JAAARDRAFT_38214 [Jaapia argillacea MUCL 33604]